MKCPNCGAELTQEKFCPRCNDFIVDDGMPKEKPIPKLDEPETQSGSTFGYFMYGIGILVIMLSLLFGFILGNNLGIDDMANTGLIVIVTFGGLLQGLVFIALGKILNTITVKQSLEIKQNSPPTMEN